TFSSKPGSLGSGGTAGHSSGNVGGNGGGGYYGGGGGTDHVGNGGGGSSYTEPDLAQNVVHTQGYGTDNGSITISYLSACDKRTPVTIKMIEPPVINSFSPTVGIAGGNVVIKGINLLSTKSISFGGTSVASFTIIADTQINVVLGGGSTGSIVLTSSGGTAIKSGFSLIPPPVFTSFFPFSGTPGTIINITGDRLSNTTAVSFAGVPAASFSIVSPTLIQAIVGTGTNGLSGNITITASNGIVSKGRFWYGTSQGNALHFDGSNDYINIPNPISGDFTIEYWMQTTQVGPAGNTWTGGNGIVDAEVGGLVNDFGTSLVGNKLFFGVGTPSLGIDVTIPSLSNVNTGKWIHVAATRVQATGEIRLYINGTLEGTGTASTNALTSPAFIRLGSIQTNFNFYNGKLDEVRIWNVVRTGTEIRNAMETGLTGTETGLVSYYNFNQGVASDNNQSENILQDLTGNYSPVLNNFSLTGPTSNWVQSDAMDIPLINSYGPTSGIAGTTITIKGIKFTGITTVTFGGSAASSFSVVSDTMITAVLSSESASGLVSVTANKGLASSAGFVFYPQPTITSFTPVNTKTGTLVTITGTGFTAVSSVTFGGTNALSYTVVSATSITATVGAGSSGSIQITTPGGTATRTGIVYITSPILSSFSPSTAPIGGVITIRGTNLSNATAVRFGGVSAASFTIQSDTVITATVGVGASGKIFVSNLLLTDSLSGFTLLNPVITSFSPTSATMGSVITIKGIRLNSINAVRFGGVAVASFTIQSDTIITATVGAGASGYLRISNTITADSLAGFTFLNPVLTSFSPASAPIGSTITIRGLNLTGVSAVRFGGVAAASFIIQSDTIITATVGAGASGYLRISNTITADSLAGFTFLNPVLTSFSPASAPIGSTITIRGINLTRVSSVRFGGVAAASFVVQSDTIITAVLGSGASGNLVISNTVKADSMSGFTVLPSIVFKGFAPLSGRSGDTITIKGTYFTGTTEVKLGDSVAQSYTVVSDSVIKAVVGAGQSGSVKVTSPNGTIAKTGFWHGPPQGNALHFDGSNDYVNINNPISGDFTIEYWMQTTQVGAAGTAWAAGKGIVDAEVGGIVNDFGTSLVGNKLFFGVGSPSTGTDINVQSISNVNTGKWTHVAATRVRATGELKLYINGMLEGTVTGSTNALTSPAFIRFGSLQTNNNFYTGKLDEVRIWNVARSEAEIRNTMQTALTGTETGLNSYYPFNQGIPAGNNTTVTAITEIVSTNAVALTNFTLTGATSNWVNSDAMDIPVIHNFTPASGATGETITIKGIKFTDVTAVTFGGITASSFVIVSDTMITAVLSSASASGAVSLITNKAVANSYGFTFYPLPTITSFAPVNAKPGTIVTITGTGFTAASSVKFGGTDASAYTVVSATSITATVGTGSSGSIDVTALGGSATRTGFMYYPNPVLTSFSPTVTAVGATITIRGTNLSNILSVRFGGIAATSFVIQSDSVITAIVGNGSSGYVAVSNILTTDSLSGFTLLPQLIVKTFAPVYGQEGDTITIKGSYFTGATEVKLGDSLARSYSVLSDSVLLVVPGSGILESSLRPTVTSPNGTNGHNGFWYGSLSGNALRMDGTNDYVRIPDASYLKPSTVTLEAWVNPGTANGLVIAKPNSRGPSGSFYESYIVSMNGGKFAATMSNISSVQKTVTQPTAYTQGRWYHVAAVFSSTSLKLYVNGVLQDSTGGMVLDHGAFPVTVAAHPNLSTFSNCTIDELRIFNTDRSASIIQDMNGSIDPSTTGLVAYYNFNQGIASANNPGVVSLFDLTANDNTATLTNSALTGSTSNWVKSFAMLPPVISSFTPAAGKTGDTIIINGKNLALATGVSFGATAAASFTIVSDTLLKAVIGSGSSGNISMTSTGGSVSNPGFTYYPAPTITSFTPSGAITGATVTITGTNLNNVTGVTFGDSVATSFTIASATSITAVVGIGASGSVKVTGLGGSATKTGFVYPNPTITSFTPINAIAGMTVTITGTNFANIKAVTFGDSAAASYTVVSPTTITAIVGTGASGSVKVTTAFASASKTGFGNYLVPTISSFVPVNTVTGDTITIKGTNLIYITDVTFGGTAATYVNVLSDTVIKAVVGTGASGAVTLTRPDFSVSKNAFWFGTTSGNALRFDGSNDFVSIPRTISEDFTIEYWMQTTQVGATGTGWAGGKGIVDGEVGGVVNDFGTALLGNKLVFGTGNPATNADLTIQSASNVNTGKWVHVAVTRAKTTGQLNMYINGVLEATGTGSTASLTSPPQLRVGSIQTGNNFFNGGIDELKIWNKVRTVEEINADMQRQINPSDAQLVAYYTFNQGSAGATNTGITTLFDLTSNNNNGTLGNFALSGTASNWVSSSIMQLPELKEFTPAAMYTGGTVTLKGKNLSGTTAVSFAGTPATSFTVLSDTMITAVVGAGASGTILVTTTVGTRGINGFSFISIPAVTSFTPSVQAQGGTVTITGVRFTGITNVSFGGVPASSFTVVSPTSITAVVGAGASGDIVVTNPNGTGTTTGFIFAPPLILSSFSPDSAIRTRTVTIKGRYFTGASAVTFGGAAAASFAVVSDSVITAIVSDAQSGSIAVTTPAGTVSLPGFTFIPPASVLSFTPNIGTAGTIVTLKGTKFNGITAVTFGSTPAASFTIVNDSVITAIIGNTATGVVSVSHPDGSNGRNGFWYGTPPGNALSFDGSNDYVRIADDTLLKPTTVTVEGWVRLSSLPANAYILTKPNSRGPAGSFFESYQIVAQAGFFAAVMSNNGVQKVAKQTVVSATNKWYHVAAIFAPDSVILFVNGIKQQATATGFAIDHGSYPVTIGAHSNLSAYTNGAIDELRIFNTDRRNNIIADMKRTINPTTTGLMAYYNFDQGITDGINTGNNTLADQTKNTFTGTLTNFGLTGTASNWVSSNAMIAPVILSFTPVTAAFGTPVTINGLGFTNATAVTFGGTAALSFTIESDSVITAVVGPGTSGSIAVSGTKGSDSRTGFEFTSAPSISNVSPINSTTGSIVTITGTNFTGATAVSFGGTPVSSFTVVSATTINAVIGSGSSGTISVTTPAGVAVVSGFIFSTPSVIVSFSPTEASPGDTITITGTNFINITGVAFGGTAAAWYTVVSSTQIKAIMTSAGSSGSVSITTTIGGFSLAGFTAKVPRILSFQPTTAFSGSTVTIKGIRLNTTTAVSFGGISAASFTAQSDTQITAVVGPTALAGNISLTTTEGSAVRSGFMYGTADNVLNMSGPSDVVNITDVPVLRPSTLTVEAWVKPSSATGTIVSKGTAYNILLSGGSYFIVASGQFSSGVPAALDVWTHLTMTYTPGGAFSLYVNGVLRTTTSAVTSILYDASPVVFGNTATIQIDEVRLFNTNRSAFLTSDMAGSIDPNTPGLIAYYDFNQGIDGGNNTGVTTLTDRTTNGNNGVLSNFALTGTSSNWIRNSISNRTVLLSSPRQVEAASQNQSLRNVVLSKFAAVVATGDNTLAKLAVTTAGSYLPADLTALKLWYRSSTDALAGSVQIGQTVTTIPVTGSTITFTEFAAEFKQNDTGYFFVTCDIAPNATVGNTLQIAANPTLTFGYGGSQTGTIAAGGAQTFISLPTVVSINAAHAAASTLGWNTNRNIIATYQLSPTVAQASLSSLQLTTAGTYQLTDLQPNGVKVWINSSNSLTGATRIDTGITNTGTGNIIMISGLTQIIPANETYFIFVTTDISGTSTHGNTIGVAPAALSGFVFASGSVVGSNPIAASALHTIVVSAITNNILSGDQTVIAGKPVATLNATNPTGGNGVFSYSWIRSGTNGSQGYATASGTNNTASYTPLSDTTAWYKRIVSSYGKTDTSNSIKILVHPTYAVANAQTTCNGTTYNLNAHSYSTPGTYRDTLFAITGADSIIVTQLTVNPIYTVNNAQIICGGKTYSLNGHSYTTVGTYRDTLHSATGCDSIIVTQLNVNPTYSTNNLQTICSVGSYSINGHTYNTAGLYRDTLHTITGCDSIIVTQLNVTPTVTVNTTQAICFGSSYTFNGHTYTSNGTYRDTLACTIIVTQLTVNGGNTFNNVQTICNGKFYSMNAHAYTVAGTYYDTLHTALGCDSFVVTQLSVNPTYTSFNPQIICSGKSYSFNGHTYSAAGNYNDTLHTITGCDSIIVTQLTVNPTYTVNHSQTICNGTVYAFNGHNYSGEGTYRDTLHAATGCDSIIVTQLHVNPSYTTNNPQSICNVGSYSVNGHTYTTAGTYRDTLHSVTGCDSIIVTQLNVTPTFAVNASQTICNGSVYTFNGHAYTTAGTYRDTLGCTIIVTQLTVNGGNTFNNVQTICSGKSYSINSHTYTLAGTYHDTLLTALGCDSFVVTQLSVSPVYSVTNSQTICNESVYAFNGHNYTVAGTYRDTLHSATGCDSIIVTQLNVNPTYTLTNPQIICNGTSYSLNGHSYSSSGLYRDTLHSVTGCDSIIVTQLTVRPALVVSNPQNVCSGNSYSINGHVYSVSGTYRDTLNSVTGCDSIIVTQLSVGSGFVVTSTPTICNGTVYAFNEHTYTTSGTYHDTVGCSIVITHLTVLPLYWVNNPKTICNGSVYTLNGHSYSLSGIYLDTLHTLLGCDSIVSTQLTIVSPVTVSNPQTICNGKAYAFNSHVYSIAGTYRDTLHAVTGCDSIIVTQLSVNPTYAVNNPQTICNGKTYTFNAHNYAVAGTYRDTLHAVTGCDSIIVTQLSVTPSFTVSNPQTICNGKTYTFNSHTYSVAGTYRDTLHSITGCDSIIVTQLIISPTHLVSKNVSICGSGSYTINAHIYTLAGTYRDTLHTTTGCDSIVVTQLSIQAFLSSVNIQTVCYGSSYSMNGKTHTATGIYYDTLQATQGCDSIVETRLTILTPYVITNPKTICSGKTYSFNGHLYSVAGTYRDTLHSVTGCDSIIVTQLNVNPSYSVNNSQTICAGSVYLFNGHTYNTTGTYRDTLHSATGCDSIIVTQLLVNPTYAVNYSQTICAGAVYAFNGHTYNTTGLYRDTLHSITGCDSIIVTQLNVNPTYSINNPKTICAGTVYAFNGHLYNTAGTYSDTLHSVTGCDSIIVTQLNVNPIYSVNYPKTICAGKAYSFNGHAYTTTGMYRDTLHSVTGCDSIIVTQLLVNPTYSFNNPQTICSGKSYSFNGHVYNISGTYRDTLHSVAGCDSIIVTQLNVNPIFTLNNPQTICSNGSYSINGHTYTSIGLYRDTLHTVNGCDSIIVTQLNVTPAITVTTPQTICSGSSYTFNGHTYTTAGTYRDTLGCTIIVTQLTVNGGNTFNNIQSVCNGRSYAINGHSYSIAGTYRDTLHTVFGCDSFVVTQLSVNPTYSVTVPKTICNGTSYSFNGHTYSIEGTYRDTLHSVTGCDSIIVTQLNVNPTYSTNNPKSICNGTTYLFNGHTYSIAGTYRDTLHSVTGCDSIIITQLNINPTYSVNNPKTICNGTSYSFNGHTYSVAGTYRDTLHGVTGCDSIIVTQLNVNPTYSVSNPKSICSGASYTFNGHTYSIEGTYRDTLHSVTGCDSIIVTQLNVNPTYSINNPKSICSGSVYTFNGHAYSIPGMYRDTLHSVTGCDSIIVTQLNVN
ncbi:MAG: IPT/TIG domain-containing protein, partial [Bacteroidota bacterium]